MRGNVQPDGSESSMVDALNRPENLLMHERFNARLIERAVPILSDVVQQGTVEGFFACEDIPERIRMMPRIRVSGRRMPG